MKFPGPEIPLDELEVMARDAAADAVRQALAEGQSVVGMKDGRMKRYFPDGRVEDLGPPCGLDEAKPGFSGAAKRVA